MKTKPFVLLATVLVLPTAAVAHHSFAMFDNAKTEIITGVVKDYQFANPHTWVDVVVRTPSGATETWGVEGGSPNQLSRQGWKKSSLKAGDKVVVRLHPLKSGATGGSLMNITLEDGRVLSGGPGGPPPGTAPAG